jgi:hypothetical protein
MATLAQALANKTNAQLSTGPKTEAGKAAVSQNATSHGLSSTRFFFLPHENPEEFAALLVALEEEHEPQTPTEKFLVTEMARAQWKLTRIEHMEAAVLAGIVAAGPQDPWAAFATELQNKPNNALAQLDRYAASARRNWHKALDTLIKYRDAVATDELIYSRVRANHAEAEVNEMIAEPLPCVPSPAPQPEYHSKPMPADLACELERHMRRDPLFDPKNDSSQMSRRLRKWFDKAAA